MGLAIVIILGIIGMIGLFIITTCTVAGCMLWLKYKKSNKTDIKSRQYALIWFLVAITAIIAVLFLCVKVVKSAIIL